MRSTVLVKQGLQIGETCQMEKLIICAVCKKHSLKNGKWAELEGVNKSIPEAEKEYALCSDCSLVLSKKLYEGYINKENC